MKQYLSNFNTKKEYESFLYGSEAPYVNISHVEDTDSVFYNKEEIDQHRFRITVTSLNQQAQCAYISLYGSYGEKGGFVDVYNKYGDKVYHNEGTNEFNFGLNSLPLKEGDYLEIVAFTDNIHFHQYYDAIDDWHYDSDTELTISGNFLSLYSGYDYMNGTVRETMNTEEVFNNSLNIVDASGLWLPTHNLKEKMFYKMFFENTHLVNIPSVEFTLSYLPVQCFSHMFNGCTSIVDASDFVVRLYKDVSSVGNGAFVGMFSNCSNLTTGCTITGYDPSDSSNKNISLDKNVSGTDVANEMYRNCPSLTTTGLDIDELTLKEWFHFNDFGGGDTGSAITSVGINSILGVGAIDSLCYNCSALLTSPHIYSCFSCFNMFAGCSSLQHVYNMGIDGPVGSDSMLQDVPSTCTYHISPLRTYNYNDYVTGGVEGNIPSWMDVYEGDTIVRYKGYIDSNAGWSHDYANISGVTDNFTRYSGWQYRESDSFEHLGPWGMARVINKLTINNIEQNVTWTDTGNTGGDGNPIYESDITINGAHIYMYYNWDNHMPDFLISGRNNSHDDVILKLNLDYTYDPGTVLIRAKDGV